MMIQKKGKQTYKSSIIYKKISEKDITLLREVNFKSLLGNDYIIKEGLN